MVYKVEAVRVEGERVGIVLAERGERGELVDGFGIWMDIDRYNSLTADQLRAILADEVSKRRTLLQQVKAEKQRDESVSVDKSMVGQEVR